MRVVLIGSVGSSLNTLLKLIEYKFNIDAVFGYEPSNKNNVSGYTNLKNICNQHGIKYFPFVKINDTNNIDIIKSISPDIVFAVGISQIISKELLDVPKLGFIGFHPTALPAGRGRAPLAWMILEEKVGAATFFLMKDGVDDGPIFVQEFFKITNDDNANSIQIKVLNAINNALDKWLPDLKRGQWDPTPQDEIKAYYYGKRAPIDGWINWEKSAIDIDRLVRATTNPYPGAFTFFRDYKVIIWETSVENELKIKGVIGRILLKRENKLLIQTGDGLLWIENFEMRDYYDNKVDGIEIKVGDKFGYNVEYEIFKLKHISKL
jgi:methionyl-tRNA formyltransferase